MDEQQDSGGPEPASTHERIAVGSGVTDQGWMVRSEVSGHPATVGTRPTADHRPIGGFPETPAVRRVPSAHRATSDGEALPLGAGQLHPGEADPLAVLRGTRDHHREPSVVLRPEQTPVRPLEHERCGDGAQRADLLP